MFLDARKVSDQFSQIFAAFGSRDSFILHSNVLNIGIVEKLKAPQKVISDYVDILTPLANEKSVLIPSFNYDFCKDGLYDVEKSPSQVGALANNLIAQNCARTRTPVFNFCLLGNKSPQTYAATECREVFGPGSLYHEFTKKDGVVVLAGVDINFGTFIHEVEETARVGYRYVKKFEGVIRYSGQDTPWSILYRVRPKGEVKVDYNWAFIKDELLQQGILKTFALGNSKCLAYAAVEAQAFWSDKLRRNENYFLTEESVASVREQAKKTPYPFLYENFE